MFPDDFAAKPKFVVATPTIGCTSKTKWVRKMPWKEPGRGLSATDLEEIASLPKFARTSVQTFSVDELDQRHEHKQAYHDFLKRSRRARISRKKSSTFMRRASISNDIESYESMNSAHDTDDEGDPTSLVVGGILDLGLPPRDGLKAPREELPQSPDGLWLERPPVALRSPDENLILRAREAVEAAAAGTSANQSTLATFESKRKRFKAAPTTSIEKRACGERLREVDFVGIIATPNIVSFGTVCVGSENSRTFSVANNLAKPILVRMDIDSMVSEISTHEPASQVIPPGLAASFEINFSSTSDGVFKAQVGYIVNESHHFCFCVDAEVMLPLLELSAPRVDFDFGDDDLSPTLTRTVYVSNPGNAIVNFEWKSANDEHPLGTKSSVYSVTPRIGRVEAFGKERIEIKYTPSFEVLSSVQGVKKRS